MTLYYIDALGIVNEGDCVIIPLGDSDSEVLGIVEKTELYEEEKAPYPPSKTKNIIGLAPVQKINGKISEQDGHDKMQKPAGYYDEVRPFDCIDDLKDFLKDFSISAKKYSDAESLKPYDKKDKEKKHPEWIITVFNSKNTEGEENKGKSLAITLSGRFTVSFGGWHAYFSPYLFDYGEMKKLLNKIFSNEMAVLSVYRGDDRQFCGCDIISGSEAASLSLRGLSVKMLGRAYFDSYFLSRGGIAELDFWNPSLSRQAVIAAENK